MPVKIKKKKKSVRQRGYTTYGHGARKKWKGKGHFGGKGMAGTGKRADHKKSLVIKKYKQYFGKQGITSKKTEKKKNFVINLRDIERNFDSLMNKFGKEDWLDLAEYKILGDGLLNKKVKIKALDISNSAREKIEKSGGVISIIRKKI